MESQNLRGVHGARFQERQVEVQAGLAHVCHLGYSACSKPFRQVCQGRLVCLLVLVLAAPILYLVFGALEWAKGVRISAVVYSPFADSALGYSGLAAFCLLLLLLGVRSESSIMVIRDLPGWLQKLVQ